MKNVQHVIYKKMIEKIFIIAFFTLGYCCAFWPGMIFGRIGDWMDTHAPEWLWKPIGGCYICACMWIGSAVYWGAFGGWRVLNYEAYPEWLVCCITAMGVNAAVSQFVDKVHKAEIEE